MSIFEDFSQETMQICKENGKEILANGKQGKISYIQYGSVICKEGRTPAQSSLRLFLVNIFYCRFETTSFK